MTQAEIDRTGVDGGRGERKRSGKKDPRWSSELSPREQRVAQRRYRMIAPLVDGGGTETASRICRATGVSRVTLWRWAKVFEREGLVGLVRRKRSDRQKPRTCDEEMVRRIRGWYLGRPRLTMRLVWKRAVAWARETGRREPNERTVERICASVRRATRCLARQGEKSYYDRFEPVARFEVDRPNQRWHMDHTPMDILLVRPKRKPAHPWLTMVLDAYSRAPMGYHLGFDKPSTVEVSLALRKAILPKKTPDWPMCGIPDSIFVDRGQELISEHMKTVAADLRFELVPSTIGPRHNARVERFNRTVNTGFLCELPGYTDSNVRKRPESVEPELTLREFEKRFERWLIDDYLRTPNRTTKETPLARWSRDLLPRLPKSVRQLDLWLMRVAKARKMMPDGIHLFTQLYVAQELVAYIGEWMVVRYDPRDLEEIEVYHGNQWVGTGRAVDPEHPFTDVREMRRLQRERRREIREEIDGYAGRPKRLPEPATATQAETGAKKPLLLYETDKLPWVDPSAPIPIE